MSGNENSTGIVLFAHGSSLEEANRSVEALAGEVRTTGPYSHVSAAFLELARPNLSEALDQAFKAGLKHVIIIPYFLTMGVHLQQDLPRLVAEERRRHPNLEITVAKSLQGHPLMASIILERVRTAIP